MVTTHIKLMEKPIIKLQTYAYENSFVTESKDHPSQIF